MFELKQTGNQPVKSEPPSRSRSWLSLGTALLFIAAILLSGYTGAWLEQKHETNSLGSSLSNQKKIVSSQSKLISQIVKTVGPSVVSVNVAITSSNNSDSLSRLFGLNSQPDQLQAAGTGIIIADSGLIMTNRHVVPQGTTSVSVTLSDGTELKDVSVVGRTSEQDSLDIAFLKINNLEGHKLIAAAIGDSSSVQVGDEVVAIGNALGQFQNTVTSGIISGFGRSVQAGDGTDNSSAGENLDDLFQTDAAINEGNSGGPLVNLNGQVIGINTAIAGDAQNIGFAIPVNDVKGLLNQVVSSGKFARPYLGIRYVPLSADIAKQYNLNVNEGAFIVPSTGQDSPSILPNGPADKAGLKEKDVITAVNGTKIDQSHSLTGLISAHKPGDKVNLTVIREGKTIHVDITLGELPS